MRKLAAAGVICLIAFLLIGAADWNTTLLNISRTRLEKAMREVGGCMRQTEDGPLKNHLGFIEDKLWLQLGIIQEMQKRLPELRKNPVSPESRKEWDKLRKKMRLEFYFLLDSIGLLEREVDQFCSQIRTKIPSPKNKKTELAKRGRNCRAFF